LRKAPRHIAIIMDGNGRWAKKRNLPRAAGHRAGAKTVDFITEECAKIGIEALTLYAFSSENWKRPPQEINALMRLLKQSLQKNAKKIKRNNIKFNVIGEVGVFQKDLKEIIKNLMNETSANNGMLLTLALNYGARQEILNAVKLLGRQAQEKKMNLSSLKEEDFEKFLYTSSIPDPDLIIRTSGELRLSNFLLWQAAYSEFYFTDTLWPDFDAGELKLALKEYENRERRFGE